MVELEVTIISAWRDQLNEIRRRDTARVIFGADQHQYQSTPVGLSEIARVEAALGVGLPAEFREFLSEIGYGAGPYYGIWSPDAAVAEIQSLAADYEADVGGRIIPAAEFPLSAVEVSAVEARIAAGSKSPAFESDWPCCGCIPICHHGCTYWSVLVLAGPFTGCVWDLACFEGFSGEWLPACRPSGYWVPGKSSRELPPLPSPPTFSVWFNGWIEQCLADLPALRSWRWPWSRPDH